MRLSAQLRIVDRDGNPVKKFMNDGGDTPDLYDPVCLSCNPVGNLIDRLQIYIDDQLVDDNTDYSYRFDIFSDD